MAGILVYSDNNDLAAELCGFSSPGHEDISVLTFDDKASEALATCGAASILQVACPEDAVPETYAKSLAEFISGHDFDLVLIGATARGRDLAPRLAGYLDCGYGGDVTNLTYDGATISFERSNYGGNVVSHERIDGMGVVTVGRGAFEKISGSVAKQSIDLVADERMKLVSREAIVFSGVDVASADQVVGIGMGFSTQDETKLADDLANTMGAALACSRGVAEERGWLPVECYIGISGKVISPKLYMTLGISGQVQHLYGVRDAKIIAAVDKNENAPITRNADYYIVGDIKEYAPLITEAIKALQ